MRTDARRLGALLVCAATLPLACIDQQIIAPKIDAIFVQAVLDVSTTYQFVTVEAVDGTISHQKVITGAQVSIITPDGRTLAAEEVVDSETVIIGFEAPRVTTLYRLSPAKYGISLVAGGTYQLRIVLPDGRRVSGSTTIPRFGTTPADTPPEPFDIARDTLSLVWPRVSGAGGYEVTISSQRGPFTVFADTAIVLPGNVRNSVRAVFQPGLTNRVSVSAVDANYYDYFRRSSDFFTGEGPISRLDGAIGVFGSIVPIMNRTLIVQSTPFPTPGFATRAAATADGRRDATTRESRSPRDAAARWPIEHR